MRSFRLSQVAGSLIFLACATVVASCASVQTYPTPHPSTSASPASTGSLTTSTTAAVTLPSLGADGIQVGGSLPIANAAASVTETVSVSAPTGVTALTRYRDTAPNFSPIVYVEFASTSPVTLSAIPALTFTSSSISSSDTYYLAQYTSSGWQTPVGSAGTVSGDTVTFASATGTVSITPTQPAIFALYASTATPSPAASPNSLLFDESNLAPQSFTVSETGYAGAFTAQTNCTASPAPSPPPTSSPYVAEVSPSTATPSSAGGSASFTVTPGEETGSCTITVSDSHSASTAVSVIVGQDNVIIYDRKRH